MEEKMFEERHIKDFTEQEKHSFFIKNESGWTINHPQRGFLRPKRSSGPRKFTTSDAAIKCLERCGIEGVQVFIKRVEG